MKTNHTDLEQLLRQDLETCVKEHDLLQIKSKYLGKNGHLTNLFSELRDIAPDRRKSYGAELNKIKSKLAELIENKTRDLKSSNLHLRGSFEASRVI